MKIYNSACKTNKPSLNETWNVHFYLSNVWHQLLFMCHWIYVLIVEQHKTLVTMVSMLDDSYFHLFPNPNCLWSYNIILGLRYKGNWESTQVETILSWISLWPSTCVFAITKWFFTHWLVKSQMVDKSLSMEMIWWWGSLLFSFLCTWFSEKL